MKLWYSPASPFARKVRVVAHELGLSDRIELVDVVVIPAKPNAELARENPLIKVPTLATDEGTLLYDSPVICEYLDSLDGGGGFFPAAGAQRWRALTLQALGDGIMDAGILRRYELAQRPAELRWNDWLVGQQTKIDHALDAADVQARGWSDTLDIGHIAIACALGWLDFRFPDARWRDKRPALAGWLARIEQRPSLVQTAPRA
jgi:glutathione S-transferase